MKNERIKVKVVWSGLQLWSVPEIFYKDIGQLPTLMS